MIKSEDVNLIKEAEDLIRRLGLKATGANIHKFRTKSSYLISCITLMKKSPDNYNYNYWKENLIKAMPFARELVYPD